MKFQFKKVCGRHTYRFVQEALSALQLRAPRKFRRLWREALRKYPDTVPEKAVRNHLADLLTPYQSKDWEKIGDLTYKRTDGTILRGRPAKGFSGRKFNWYLTLEGSYRSIFAFATPTGGFPARTLCLVMIPEVPREW
jgi:hypothetical protein